MRSHKEKYFTQALQICVFFKYHTKPWEDQLPEIIKLMTLDELYANITHTEYQTKLMKQIIIFLLDKVHQPKFIKNRIGGSVHYLVGLFQNRKKQIIQNYYLQMALQQYFYIQDIGQNVSEFVKVYNFYQLNLQLKFNLLCTLVENVYNYNYQIASKNKKQEQKQSKEQVDKLKKIGEILILGQDNKYVYLFASFQPSYVLTLYLKRWQLLNKNEVQQKIKKILSQPMSPNAIFLAQNLTTVYSKLMEQVKDRSQNIRLHKVAPYHNQKLQVQGMRKKLLQINNKYNIYLRKFKNRCWGYLEQRKKYQNKLINAQTLDQLVQAQKQFFLVSYSKLYILKDIDQNEIKQGQQQQYYLPQSRPHCNINTVAIKLEKDLCVKSQQITRKILEQQHVDLYALFQINVMVLDKAIQYLNKKSQRYYQKMQKMKSSKCSKIQSQSMKQNSQNTNKMKLREKSVKSFTSSLNSIEVSEEGSSFKTQGVKLRQKKKNKRYGVQMIDSDQQKSSSTVQLHNYEYKTRSVVNK